MIKSRTWAGAWAKTWSRIGLTIVLLVAPVMAWSPASAIVGSDHAGVRSFAADPGATHRLIVKLKTRYQAFSATLSSSNETSFSKTAGVNLHSLRAMSGGRHVMMMEKSLSGAELDAVVAKLSTDPTIESVEPDVRMYPAAVPNDPYFASQWYLQAIPANQVSPSINVVPAWAIVPANAANITVAVIDTGARFDHPDLYFKYMSGYDFISADCLIVPDNNGTLDPKVALYQSQCTTSNAYFVANNGHGRSPDATDPGDWVSGSDLATNTFFTGCPEEDSSWHGTRVAGLIAAQANNGVGIAGVSSQAHILPVRALGKCGGYTSDIVDAIYWAAGVPSSVHNSTVPDNTTPARIINLSLGSRSATVCQSGSAYYTAIQTVIARGVVVVAAAGNGSASLSVPASCPGVISVGALSRDGLRTTYSNTGSSTGSIGANGSSFPAPPVTLMAPGGEQPVPPTLGSPTTVCTTSDVGICSTINNGAQTPLPYSKAATDGYAPAAGTSFSAPLVSGIAALVAVTKPGLTVAQISSALTAGARTFINLPYLADSNGNILINPVPACTLTAGSTSASGGTSECNCSTGVCGAGMADALNSVATAIGYTVTNVAPVMDPEPDQTVTAGSTISFRLSGYDANIGDSVQFVMTGQPAGATFDVNTGIFTWTPASSAVAATYPLSVFGTDGTANGTAVNFNLVVNAAPAASSGGGGGGGSADLVSLGLLLLLLATVGLRARKLVRIRH